MENPYVSPNADGPASSAGEPTSRLVRYVGFVSVFMMVQGAAEILVGIGATLMGAMIPVAGARGGAAGVPNATLWLGAAVYLVAGLVAVATGALRVFAGVRNLKYRGRVLGIVALACGFLTMMTGLCAPTSIVLLVWGLIVYLNGDVARAFEMAGEGVSPAEVRARLGV